MTSSMQSLQTAGLAVDACSLVLRADGDSSRALEYLEQGRGLILGHLFDGRGDISGLKTAHPTLAEEFEALRYKISAPVKVDDPVEVHRQFLQNRETAAKNMDNYLREIRKLPGYDLFLLLPSLEDLKGYSAVGPIIVVNITEISSDALLLTSSGIEHLRLPDLMASEIKLNKPWTLTRNATRDAKLEEDTPSDEAFHDFLCWLWSSCVSLVLGKLGFLGPGRDSKLPRIWWIATGLASSIPFHAAGDPFAGLVANTISHAISSYTPSIKALCFSRERMKANIGELSILLVTMIKTPGARDLPGADAEAENVSKGVRYQSALRILKMPSSKTVLDALRNFNIAHFACHGLADLADPSNSFLALQDASDCTPDKLTVRIIYDADLNQAWLAYLSACSTAEIKVPGLTDEALHLAGSFQVAGFRHVASIWPSDDAICAQIATLFYQNLFANNENSCGDRAVPAALHAAVAEVRSQQLEPATPMGTIYSFRCLSHTKYGIQKHHDEQLFGAIGMDSDAENFDKDCRD